MSERWVSVVDGGDGDLVRPVRGAHFEKAASLSLADRRDRSLPVDLHELMLLAGRGVHHQAVCGHREGHSAPVPGSLHQSIKGIGELVGVRDEGSIRKARTIPGDWP